MLCCVGKDTHKKLYAKVKPSICDKDSTNILPMKRSANSGSGNYDNKIMDFIDDEDEG